MVNPIYTGWRQSCSPTRPSRCRPFRAVIVVVGATLMLSAFSACDSGSLGQTAVELQRENRDLRADIEKLQFRVYQLERETDLDRSAELTLEELERRRQECVEERGEDNMICMSLP